MQHGLRPRFALAQDRLGHNDGTIHDDTKIDRTEREKIRRHPGEMHDDEYGDQRERNRHRRDHRTARATQEKNQHDAHQHHAFDNRVRYLAHRRLYQVVAVDERHDANVQRRELFVQCVYFGMNALEYQRRVLVLEQVDDAFDGIRIIVLAENAFANLMAVLQLSEVAYPDRVAVVLGDDDIAHVLE